MWQLLRMRMSTINPPRLLQKWGLHPLIHTLLEFNLAQDIEEKKAKPVPPHFFSLNQDIVAWSQGEKCGLKYVIHIPDDQPKLQMNMFTLSSGIMPV